MLAASTDHQIAWPPKAQEASVARWRSGLSSIGLSLAFGVLAGAFIVRMTLVPAVMVLLGKRAWWMPKRLERIVPDVDIEGEAVMKGAHAS